MKRALALNFVLALVAFTTGRMLERFTKIPNPGNEYRTGWKDAVRDCYAKRIIMGPLIITGDQTRFEGGKLTVVNILNAGPSVMVTNAPGARISVSIDTDEFP